MKACLLSKMSIFHLKGSRDKRKRKWREGGGGGGGGGEGDYFKYFRQRGAIIRGTAIIRGNTVSVLGPFSSSFILMT